MGNGKPYFGLAKEWNGTSIHYLYETVMNRVDEFNVPTGGPLESVVDERSDRSRGGAAYCD